MINKMLLFAGFAAVLFAFVVSPVQADLIWPIPEFTPEAEEYKMNYLVLVNKENPMHDAPETEPELVSVTNSLEADVNVETKTYAAYLTLKSALAEEDIFIDIDSAYRSEAEQQLLLEEFAEQYGEDYAKEYAAVPGYSEHHTGLALDLYLIIDGADVYLNEDLVQYPEIWTKIHAKLADHGFILRYPEGKEDITGYPFEPWHIRYIDDPAIAKEIMEKGLTLEEYLQK